ncbi:unnamed protein product [Clonostachys rhizophaga]|uniref:Uncharacterized protein n=1 Tax=Clonostachys rhizophaga TaxID=160324 RepID=A0A9N9V2R7_9HYPO|nr:unnamed protein product [Clonostachys rhizophaga]
MEHQPYAPRTPRELQELSRQHGDKQVIWQCQQIARSASKWNYTHLIIFRLLVQQDATILPILDSSHTDPCPVCNPALDQDHSLSTGVLNEVMTKALTSRSPGKLLQMSEGEILMLQHGFFWVALAEAARPELVEQAREHPQRERKQHEREGYISSAIAIDGSSSPTGHSSSEYEADSNPVHEDWHLERRTNSEEMTVRLVLSFLQHALNICLVQATGQYELRPRARRMFTRATIGGDAITISAEDDGGICLMRRLGSGWEMGHPYCALFEAKRAPRNTYFDEKREEHVPLILNENLAQWLGEAIVTWKANMDVLQNGNFYSVFMIAASNTFVHFLHSSFGKDYLEYLDAMDEAEQRDIIGDEDKDQNKVVKWQDEHDGDGESDEVTSSDYMDTDE